MTDEDDAGPGEDDRRPAAGPGGTTSEGTATPESRRNGDQHPDDATIIRDGEERGSGGNPETDDEREGNVAGILAREQPLEPGTIDVENALFVLFGVVIVVGFLVLAIAGL